MKKKFTKIAAAALAVAMTVASAVPTFAYDKTPETCTGHSYMDATVESDHIHEICIYCGKGNDIYFTKDPSECTHENTDEYNYRSSCTEEGRHADIICKDCGTILEVGTPFPARGHHWDAGVVTKEPTKTEEGVKTYTCEYCGGTRTESIPKLAGTDEPSTPQQPSTGKKDDTTTVVKPTKPTTAKVGTKFVVSGQTYKVTKIGKEVSFIAAKKNAKSVSIPATVKSKGITYKVTSIAAKAVKSNKKAKSITIGANVSKIASNAFYKCPNVKTITIKSTKLTKKTASKKMVSGLNKKLVVKVPKKVKKSYTKIFKRLKIK